MSVKQVEVCFSPFHIPLFDLRKKAVVVIDVYRATSAIVAGIGTGVDKIIPVSTVEEAKEYRAKGYITAAERKGAVVAGFDIGNSPITFSDSQYKGKSIVLTTSNGTKALLKATQAKEIIVAAFLNETAVAEYVNKNHDSVMILCAGWRDRFNLEDTVVAGSIAKKLLDLGWNTDCDSCLTSMHLDNLAGDNMLDFMKNASHTKRLAHLKLEEDIAFCNQKDLFDVVPVYNSKGEIMAKK